MAPSSLKKMSGVQKSKEGNYASLETMPRGRSTKFDLGLTLLPGSQIQRKGDIRSGTATESSSRTLEGKQAGRSKQWKSFETEIQPKHLIQASPRTAKSPSSSSDPGPDSAKIACVTARINREGPSSQSFPTRNGSGVVQHSVNSVTAAPCDELDTSEIINANSCHHDDRSPRAVKRRKLGSRASNEVRDSKVSKGKEAAFKTHYNRFHMHHDQYLFDINAVRSESSKPESRRQITHSPYTAPARSDQSTVLGSKDTALHGSSSTSAALASRSSVKHRYSEPEKLTVRFEPPKPTKSVSTQHGKSRLFLGTPADIGTQVLKPRREVNRSWTSHFPATVKNLRSANLPAPSFSSTRSEAHEQSHPSNALLTSTNLHTHTHFSSIHPSPSLFDYSNLSNNHYHPSDICAPEHSFNTAHAGSQRQSARRRSASMPNLSSTSASMNMDSFNSIGPASIPTPPQEKPSPHYTTASLHLNLVDPPINHTTRVYAGNSAAQKWQSNSHHQYQPEVSLSDTQNIGFTSGLHPHQVLTQSSHHQDVTRTSISKDGAITVGEPHYVRRRLEVKPSYSYDEVKSIMFNVARQAQTLKAENATLQSQNMAMKIGSESLQNDKEDMRQRIQHYEHIIVQKDQQIEAMRRTGFALQHHYKRIWEEHRRLLATIRKGNGAGNPSAIVETIRSNHLPNAVGTASQGRKASANASPVYCANGAHPPLSQHEFHQTSRNFQGGVQPISFSGSPEAIVANASSRVSVEPPFAAANYNSTNSPHHGSSGWVPPHQPLDATVKTVTSNGHDNELLTEQISTERVTIDLTDDSQPPSSSASRDTSVHQMRQSSIQGGYPPSNLPPGQYSAGCFVSSQYPPGPSTQIEMSRSQPVPDQDPQGQDLEAMQIQKQEIARMAEKPLSWLLGVNPHRRGANTEQRREMSTSRHPSQNNAKDLSAQYPEVGRVAPLPETATGRKTKKAPKKARIILDAEAKKERAKLYRKTAAEKKKREKEITKQSLEDEDVAKRARKQDRRVAKEARRQHQAQKPSEQVGTLEPQKKLDGQLYQEATGAQQAIHGGSMEQVASDDEDSLFGDSEMEVGDSPNTGTIMQDDDAAAAEAAMVAEMEAELEADEDAEGMARFEQSDAFGGQTCATNAVPSGDHGYHDFSSESEESEEE